MLLLEFNLLCSYVFLYICMFDSCLILRVGYVIMFALCSLDLSLLICLGVRHVHQPARHPRRHAWDPAQLGGGHSVLGPLGVSMSLVVFVFNQKCPRIGPEVTVGCLGVSHHYKALGAFADNFGATSEKR